MFLLGCAPQQGGSGDPCDRELYVEDELDEGLYVRAAGAARVWAVDIDDGDLIAEGDELAGGAWWLAGVAPPLWLMAENEQCEWSVEVLEAE